MNQNPILIYVSKNYKTKVPAADKSLYRLMIKLIRKIDIIEYARILQAHNRYEEAIEQNNQLIANQAGEEIQEIYESWQQRLLATDIFKRRLELLSRA